MKNTLIKRLCALATFTLVLGLAVPVAYADDDLQAPGDVEGLEATAGNEEITLTWDMATDNVGVTGYKIYYGIDSVVEDGGSYTFGSMEVGEDLSYTVTGLENEVTYYFALTAVDAAGNESEYYSEEVSAMPMGEGEDTEAPVVVDAQAPTDMVVEVSFSEDVALPADGSTAFSILNLETEEELVVLDAYVSDDASVVLVTTETQTEGVEYEITVGTEVTDLAENAMVSGTSDTAVFDGGAAAVEDDEGEEVTEDGEDEEPVDEDDTEAPEIDKVESTTVTEIVVTFDEAVVLPEEAAEASFEVTLAEDGTAVAVLGAMLDEEDSSKVVLETEELAPGEDYILVATGVLDAAGNELTNTFDRTASFMAATLDLADLIAPEDVTDFVASLMDDVSVELTWTASVDSAGDLDDQLLYTSEDGEDYGDSESLGADTTSYEAAGLTAGMTYTFKLTTVDEAGNESEGVITTVTLPETGAGLGAVLLATMLGTHVVTRRKKK